MTSKSGMQYTFLINYAQLLAYGLPLALMHSVFCHLACVTCHSPLSLPNQVTASPLTCCPFPLTETCCWLLFWAFKLERARFEAMHVHRHSLSSSKWLRLHFEHSSWRCHLPINTCACRVWHTAGAIYPNSLYLLPLTLTDCSDTERLFWFKQKPLLFLIGFFVARQKYLTYYFAINLTGCCSNLSKNAYARTLSILAGTNF